MLDLGLGMTEENLGHFSFALRKRTANGDYKIAMSVAREALTPESTIIVPNSITIWRQMFKHGLGAGGRGVCISHSNYNNDLGRLNQTFSTYINCYTGV